MAPSDRLNPSFSTDLEAAGVPDDQPAVIMGPPAYASPDPATSAVPLLPLEDRPLDATLSEDYAADELAVGNVGSLPGTLSAEGGSSDAWAEFPDDEDKATKADYQKVAKAYGLATSGSKTVLKDRIAEHEELLQGDENMKAADWIAEVEATDNADELAALKARYDATGAEFSTVDDAFEKAEEDLNGS